jgi:hypothetical protein
MNGRDGSVVFLRFVLMAILFGAAGVLPAAADIIYNVNRTILLGSVSGTISPRIRFICRAAAGWRRIPVLASSWIILAMCTSGCGVQRHRMFTTSHSGSDRFMGFAPSASSL